MPRTFLAATLTVCLLSACTSPASLAAGVVNTASSQNPYWNWSMTQMVQSTDCNQDGQLSLDEINRSWSVSDDDQANRSQPLTAAEYAKAVAETAKLRQSATPTALISLLTSYHRNHTFLGPCR
jgi:hypothetical protein